MPRTVRFLPCLLFALLLGCQPAALPVATTPPTAVTTSDADPAEAAVTGPPPNGTFDYQISGPYAPRSEVRIVGRDRSEQPVAGRYTICYVNAFQTQPEQASFWKREHPDLLLHRAGKPVTDPDWPGEFILDTTTSDKRRRITTIVGRWIDDCATRGFRAVEPDNLDSYTRFDDLLTADDNEALATLLVRRAHRQGLAIAQKNTGDLGSRGREQIGFDFAIAEECQYYKECGDFTDTYGANVIEIEYTDLPKATAVFEAACRQRGDTISIILRDRDVVPATDPDYRYRSC
ncbi:endo alpha-1,4 polygalactosaminidase [Microlunatus soli]|uniref:Glycoside-hydrolase family GH114 n=1 Tax=Microlunatus soli TaxID=630515 RepID=A0A1H1UTA2_9ACTN|nr:endo alpha-1,4 polygalactosaminidase [Microlunatus soli]SDS75772.1 Glycoside-hydrolase family GH114 [Microlunatus soli]